jgi:hypothetical protein
MPAGSPRETIKRGRLALLSLGGSPMLRWLLLIGMGFALVKGVQNGWVELHWNRLFHDAGVPFVPDPDQGPAGSGANRI